MKRRSTEAEQRLRRERGALRQSSKEQAEELSDALARAELAEQRLGERPADDETEELRQRLKGYEIGVGKLTAHCQSLTDALAAVEARGARRHARGKAREAKLAGRESAAADAAIEAQRQRDEATADLVGANAMIVTLRSELAESARLLRESGAVKGEPQPTRSPGDPPLVRFKSPPDEVGESEGSESSVQLDDGDEVDGEDYDDDEGSVPSDDEPTALGRKMKAPGADEAAKYDPRTRRVARGDRLGNRGSVQGCAWTLARAGPVVKRGRRRGVPRGRARSRWAQVHGAGRQERRALRATSGSSSPLCTELGGSATSIERPS